MKFQKKKSKKILATALAIGLMCSLVPLGAIEAFAIPPFQFAETLPGDGGGSQDENFLSVHFNESIYFEELNTVTSTIPDENLDGAYLNVRCYINQKITNRPSASTSYNTVDYLFYMLGELNDMTEWWVDTYGSITNEFAKREAVNNLMLGYLRSLDISYTESYQGKWTQIAGAVNTEFVDDINTMEETETGIEVREYFASFIQDSNNYNSDLHGTIDNAFLNKNYLLQDPLGSGQGIDLLHMFASMDGIYESTEESIASMLLFNRDHQHDLVSWLGDLQSFTKEMRTTTANGIQFYNIRDYRQEDGTIDFNDFISNGIESTSTILRPTSFSGEDLLADIDAMNITRLFINGNENSLSTAIMGYYKTFKADSSSYGNRYYEFVFTTTRSLEFSSTGSLYNDFRNEVFRSMNINADSESLVDSQYYNPSSPLLFDLELLKNSDNTIPSFALRKYCAKLFFDYVTIRSNRF